MAGGRELASSEHLAAPSRLLARSSRNREWEPLRWSGWGRWMGRAHAAHSRMWFASCADPATPEIVAAGDASEAVAKDFAHASVSLGGRRIGAKLSRAPTSTSSTSRPERRPSRDRSRRHRRREARSLREADGEHRGRSQRPCGRRESRRHRHARRPSFNYSRSPIQAYARASSSKAVRSARSFAISAACSTTTTWWTRRFRSPGEPTPAPPAGPVRSATAAPCSGAWPTISSEVTEVSAARQILHPRRRDGRWQRPRGRKRRPRPLPLLGSTTAPRATPRPKCRIGTGRKLYISPTKSRN